MEEYRYKIQKKRPAFLQGLMLLLVGTYLLLTALGISIAIQFFLGPFLILYGLYLMINKTNVRTSNNDE